MLCSVDTNILLYAANEDAEEHQPARKLIAGALQEPSKWIVADQVLFELYQALRNPGILQNPLSPEASAERLDFLHKQSGFLRCRYDAHCWNPVYEILSRPETPRQRTFDVVLGVTLARNGVTHFYTRNTKDFAGIGFKEVINPIDRP
ncbi:type II toxin-antitoxin system VapC family toxin [soil metagenome]